MEREAVSGSELSSRSSLVGKMIAFFKERKYEDGERLPSERALSERFAVSRNALREALSTLETLRVVEARPNSGIYLRRSATDTSFETIVLLSEMGATPTPQEVQETLEARWPLEMRAVQLACERREDADLRNIEAVLTATRLVLAESGNISQLDTEFHLAIIRSTHNEVMVRLLNSFYRMSEKRRFALFADAKRGAESAKQHERLYEAIRARDASAAASLMDAHMGRAKLYWREILGSSQTPASKRPSKS